MNTQFLDHSGEHQVCLIGTRVEAGDQHDGIDVTRYHTRVLQREDGNLCQRFDKPAIGKFAGRNFADADKHWVIVGICIDMKRPIFCHMLSPPSVGVWPTWFAGMSSHPLHLDF